MANTAADNLQSLMQATQDTQDLAAQQASLATERGTGAGAMSNTTEKQEAGFAVPEALATAAVGTFLFGPVGGLLLGAAQGWLGKQEKQNILDQAAARNEAIGGAESILRGQFDSLLEGAKNPNDIEQLEALRTQQEAAFKFMRAGDPKLQEKGMMLLQSVQDQANGYAQLQETQRIEKEVRDADLKQKLDEQGYTRFTQLEDDFAAESQNFEDVMSQTNLALEALERGNPADLWAASLLVNKALDPTSVVRQEEAAAIGTLGSLWDKAMTIAERSANGQSILPQQRRELSALVTTVQNGVTQLQLSREARYREQLIDAEVPVKYWDNFSRTANVPAYEQGELQNAENLFTGEGDSEGIINDYLEATRLDIMSGVDAVTSGFEKGFNAVEQMLKRPNPKPTGQMKRGHN